MGLDGIRQRSTFTIMLTSSQLRAARAMTGMTTDQLSAASGLSTTAIEDAEAAHSFAPPDITERLRTLFEAHGVVFLAAGEGGAGPGVRLREQPQDEGIRPQNLNATNDD